MKALVIGTGNNGSAKVRDLCDSEHVDEVLVYDIDPARTAAMAEKHGARPVSDLSTAVADADLVAISTPNDTHASLTVDALAAGKPVLCEKPMATTLADATAMVEAAERTNGFLQVGFELRYSLLYKKVKDWIDTGLLGQVMNTQCTFVTSEYLGRNSWRADPDICGDMLGEKLSHYFDIPRWWLGGSVTEVYAVSAPNVVPYFKIPDNYHVIYRFADGSVSELTYFMGPAATIQKDPLLAAHGRPLAGDGHELRYIVYGTRGAAQIEVYGRRITRWELGEDDAGMTGRIVEELSWEQPQDSTYYHNTRDETLDVVRRVVRGMPPSIDPRDALETTRLCFAARESAQTGRLVSV